MNKDSRRYQVSTVFIHMFYHIWTLNYRWITKCRHRKTYIEDRLVKYSDGYEIINKETRCVKCRKVMGTEQFTKEEYKRIQREEKLERILDV